MLNRNLTIEETAHWLNERLLANDLRKFKHVAIIAHSMGGLVAREMVLQLNGNPQMSNTQIGILVEMGTPHDGTQNYMQLGALLGLPATQIVEQMKSGSPFLSDLQTHWNSLTIRPSTYCLTSPQDAVVPARSAEAHCDRSSELPVTGHRELAKPDNATDDRYRIPMAHIKESFDSSLSILQSTPQNTRRANTTGSNKGQPHQGRSSGADVAGNVVVQPGAVASFGQQGGQTAQLIINNAPQPPPPPGVSICISDNSNDDGHTLQLAFNTDTAIVEPWFALYFDRPIMKEQSNVVFSDGSGAFGFMSATTKDQPDASYIFRLTSVNFGLGRWVPTREIRAVVRSKAQVRLTRVITGSGEDNFPEKLSFPCGGDPLK
jgi:hypothetical protein